MSHFFVFATIFGFTTIIAAANSQSSFSSSPCRYKSCFGQQQVCLEVTTDSSTTVADNFYRESFTSVNSNNRAQAKCLPTQAYGDYCGPENGNGGPYIKFNTPNFPCESNEKCIVTRRCAQGLSSCYPAVTCLRGDSGVISSPIGSSNNQIDQEQTSVASHCGDGVICPAGQQCIMLQTFPATYQCMATGDSSVSTSNELGGGGGDGSISCGPTTTCRPDQVCITLKTYPPRYRCVNGRGRSSNYSPQLYSDDVPRQPSSRTLIPAAPTRCAQLQCAVNRPGTVCIKVQQQSDITLPLTAHCVPKVNDSQDYCQPRYGLCSQGSSCALALPKCVASNSMTANSECVPFVSCYTPTIRS